MPKTRDIVLVIGLALLGLGLRYAARGLAGWGWGIDPFLEDMCHWDCNWYADLSHGGYGVPNERGLANWAFFPVTAIGFWLIHTVLPVSDAAAGAILGMGCTIATAFVVAPLFTNSAALWLFRLFILAGPFSYAYATGMSEPVFMLLTVLVFVGIAQRNYAQVVIAGVLLTATRVTGIFITVPVAMHILEMMIRESQGPLLQRLRANLWPIASLAAIPTGLLAVMLIQYVELGDPLAFVHVQSAWGRKLGNPLVTIFKNLFVADKDMNIAGALSAVLGLVAAVVLAIRRRWGMAAFVALTILMSASMGLASMMRFVIGLAPVTIVAAEVFGGGRVRWGIAAVVALVLCIPFAIFWMGGSPVFT